MGKKKKEIYEVVEEAIEGVKKFADEVVEQFETKSEVKIIKPIKKKEKKKTKKLYHPRKGWFEVK